MPAIGTPASGPRSRTSAYTSDDERISGSIDSGMPMSAAMSGTHCSVSRSMSMVREALVTSVRCTPFAAPPLRFHTSQLSIVPNASSPASARARAPSTLSSSQRTFGPAK